MALNNLFKNMKREGYIVKPLDMFLENKNNQKDNDRAIDVNAPSQAGQCLRHNYYMRKQYLTDGTLDARTIRIFDNGTKTHERLQEYMLEMGLLIIDEVPLINDEYNIQGHTDGFLNLGNEVAILEIKSINDYQFKALKDAKPEHKKQGLIYLFCAEERRKFLREYYKDWDSFYADSVDRDEYYGRHYLHIKDGNKYTAEEKVSHEMELNDICDDILIRTEKPISKVIFLYENKNNQELKEFVVERNSVTENLLTEELRRYKELNSYCNRHEVPPREGENKSCSTCRWCQYKGVCWVL